MVLFAGELSNIFMVPWHAARFCEWPTVADMLSLPSTISFTFLRTIVAPYYTWKFFLGAFTTDHGVPWSYMSAYLLAFGILLFGSWYWAYLLVRGYIKHHSPGALRPHKE